MSEALPARIAIVGTSGAGKSSLATAIGERFGHPVIELDALHWEPGWTSCGPSVFRERVDEATAAPAWACAGNYSEVRDLVWGRADLLLWLDYPFAIVLGRLLRRTARRVWTGELLWGTNRERLWTAIATRESIVRWACVTHFAHRRRFRLDPGYLAWRAKLRTLRFRHPRRARAWLESTARARACPASP